MPECRPAPQLAARDPSPARVFLAAPVRCFSAYLVDSSETRFRAGPSCPTVMLRLKPPQRPRGPLGLLFPARLYCADFTSPLPLFAQRASTAFRPCSLNSFLLNFRPRALPPRAPSVTAAAFTAAACFFFVMLRIVTCVAPRMEQMSSPFAVMSVTCVRSCLTYVALRIW